MPRATVTPDFPSSLVLRGPADLEALGHFIRAGRLAAGFRSARQAAPHLGVTTRLLAEVERGGRTKRGISLGKLLNILQQLGYEVQLRPRQYAMAGLGTFGVTATGTVAEPGEATAELVTTNQRKPTNRRATKKRVLKNPHVEQGKVG